MITRSGVRVRPGCSHPPRSTFDGLDCDYDTSLP